MAPRVESPRLVLLFSGKRKSGKDFVTDELRSRLGTDVCAVLRLSGPLKEQYAQAEYAESQSDLEELQGALGAICSDPPKVIEEESAALSECFLPCFEQERGLDFQQLLDASSYKETFRQDMIRWGEERRKADPGFFCRKIVEGVPQPVWLVSDARRVSDIQWFQSSFGDVTQLVRVVASEESRRQRGWVFTAGVDDAESECGLDHYGAFDWVIENDSEDQNLEQQLGKLLAFIHSKLQPSVCEDRAEGN